MTELMVYWQGQWENWPL